MRLSEIRLKSLDEARSLAPQDPFTSLCSDFGTLISMNFVKLSSYAVDQQASTELNNMIKNLRQPAINGLPFSQAWSDKKIMASPTGKGMLLKWIYNALQYVIPRCERYLNDEGKKLYLPRLEQIKKQYIDIVQKSKS